MPSTRPKAVSFATMSDGTPWRCGQKSAFALSDVMGRSTIRCEHRGRDRYRRIIAVCFMGITISTPGWSRMDGLLHSASMALIM